MSDTNTTIVAGKGVVAKFGNVKKIRPDSMPDGAKADNDTFYSGPVPVKAAIELLSEIQPVKGTVHVTYSDNDGNKQVVSADKFCGVVNSRNGDVFSLPTSGYEPHGYADWGVSLTRQFSKADIDTVGYFRDGARAFVMFGADGVENSAGYDFRPQIMFMSSLDGTVASTHTEFVRAFICYNGVFSVEQSGKKVSAKHTKHSHKNRNLDKYTATFGSLDAVAVAFAAQVEEFVKTEITDKQMSAIMDAYVPLPKEDGRGRTMAENKRDELWRLLRSDSRVDQWNGTLLGWVQAVNTYGQHSAIVRGADDSKSDLRQQRNIENLFSGKIADSDRDALTVARRVLATV